MFSMFGRTGAPTKGQIFFSYCQSVAAAIVVCIAAPVLNKMSMMTTVRVGPDSVGWRQSGGVGIKGYSCIRGPHIFSEQVPHLEPCVYMSVVQKVIATIGPRLCLFPAQLRRTGWSCQCNFMQIFAVLVGFSPFTLSVVLLRLKMTRYYSVIFHSSNGCNFITFCHPLLPC